MRKLAKSPLRYPGGKSRALKQILPLIPVNISEFREPFVGGGSVFFAIRSLFQNRINSYWIIDMRYLMLAIVFFLTNSSAFSNSIETILLVPSDQKFKHKNKSDINNIMSEVNDYFSREIERHGYGKSFFEYDDLTVKIVDQHSDAFKVDTSLIVKNLVGQDRIKIVFIAGLEVVFSEGKRAGGVEWGGICSIPLKNNYDRLAFVTAHELGHAFGLPHPKENMPRFLMNPEAGDLKLNKAVLTKQEAWIVSNNKYLKSFPLSASSVGKLSSLWGVLKLK